MRLSILAVSLMLATSLHAATPRRPADLCISFKHVIAASAEQPPFASISGADIDTSDRQTKLALPGFASCVIEGYRYDNPGYVCLQPGLSAAAATSRVNALRSTLETCLGLSAFKDPNRASHPWVLRKGPGQYPMAWINILPSGEVAVGYVAAYRQPR